MAEKDLDLADGQEESGSKKSMLLYIIIGIVAVGAGIGGTLFFIGKGNSGAASDAAPEIVLQKKARYQSLKPAFIVNYKDGNGRQRFLQIGVSVMSRDPEALEALKAHEPLLRNNLILLFGSQSFSVLQTPEGKDALAEDTLLEIQTLLEAEIGRPGIEKVLFTDLVMQ